MAAIYKRCNIWYLEYFVDGQRFKRSLKTKSKQIAEHEKVKFEIELERGNHGLAPKRINAI